MEWRRRGSSRNNSFDLSQGSANSQSSSRAGSPFRRPPARMENKIIGHKLARKFSEDHFSSDEDKPAAKRRAEVFPRSIALKQSTALKNSILGNVKTPSPESATQKRGSGAAVVDSKYAASSTQSPRRNVVLPGTKPGSELLKSLLTPATSSNQPVNQTARIPLGGKKRSNWFKTASTAAAAKPPKIIAKSSGTAAKISTLTEVQEQNKKKKPRKKKEWWEDNDSDSSEESELDEVDALVAKLNKGRASPEVLPSPSIVPSSSKRHIVGDDLGDAVLSSSSSWSSPKKPPSLDLPALVTQDEKDLLGEIFEDLQRMDVEPLMEDAVPSYPPHVPAKREKSLSPEVIQIDESDSEPETNLKIHTDQGNVPVYNPVTYSHTAENAATVELRTEIKASSSRAVKKGKVDRDFMNFDRIMAALPESQSFWKVSKEDKMRAKGSYLQQSESRLRRHVCHRCGAELTGKRHFCADSCALCHGTDHAEIRCPFRNTVLSLKCRRCGVAGHVEAVCPEIWRQYHDTTSHDGPVNRVAPAEEPVKYACCFNCGNAEHYGHECRRSNADRNSLPLPSPLVKVYDQPGHYLRHAAADALDQHPLDEFHDFVTNNMTEDDAQGRSDHAMRAGGSGSARRRSASGGGGSPKKKRHAKNGKHFG